MNGYEEEFRELYIIEDEELDSDWIILASVGKVEALIDLKIFNKTRPKREVLYSMIDLPKIKNNRHQNIVFGNKYFDYKRAKRILDKFFGRNVEVGLYIGEGASILLFKLDEDYGIGLVCKIDNKKEDKHEILYKWDELFFHKNFGDDMEL